MQGALKGDQAYTCVGQVDRQGDHANTDTSRVYSQASMYSQAWLYRLAWLYRVAWLYRLWQTESVRPGLRGTG